ncbi:monovalent cation:proton antiporter-2 (CPA2) family protein [Pseudomonas sp. LS44]|uniref:monovalent cation:proton antiporter family protein n=1 Tax=Pseudomonas sp. LS44 TaxID=1357074 RepID=UPI00215B7605|nr:monovalent cation:proton antiporter family protein [Pseudomonas sp. LS44]UVE16433.1 monovalent cation:proton antiporter-2 (CPA2) family protein [Pseudomonas sp. LS44]
MSTTLLIILSSSLVVIALFRRLNLPPVLGYLFVGVLINPAALGWVSHSETLPRIAELGVVFLLFTLGLEFSLPRMLALRSVVFGLGSAQVIACGLPLGALLFYGFDFSLTAALLLGTGLALSSTAIVTKELSSLGEVLSSHGQNAIGVLLLQDLVAVLLLTLLPALTDGAGDKWLSVLALTLGKAVLLFAGLFLASRWILPRLFHEVAAARSPELFVLLALVLVLLTAWLTHLLGLSMALGAFLAGMLLGESHYRHQIEADIRPFRDILLGLFFVSVGMLIDFHLFLSHGLQIAAFTLVLMLIKGGVVALLVTLRGADNTSAWRSGLALAQGGEFFFALVTLAAQTRLLPPDSDGVLLAATFCSMALTPLLLRAAPKLATRLARQQHPHSSAEMLAAASRELSGHVVICGYGRVGQSIGRFLRRENIPYVALDDDPVRVQEAAAGEACVHYGDSRRAELLEAVGLVRARLLVVAVNDAEATLAIVQRARLLYPQLAILVRTRDDSYLPQLQAAGATEVVPEVLESSLMLAASALILLGLAPQQVQTQVDEVRRSRYRLLHGYYPGANSELINQQGQQKVLLHAVNLNEDAYACGRQLDELMLEELGVEVQAVRRAGEEVPLTRHAPLHQGDAVVLSGPLDAIESCEARLLGGLR